MIRIRQTVYKSLRLSTKWQQRFWEALCRKGLTFSWRLRAGRKERIICQLELLLLTLYMMEVKNLSRFSYVQTQAQSHDAAKESWRCRFGVKASEMGYIIRPGYGQSGILLLGITTCGKYGHLLWRWMRSGVNADKYTKEFKLWRHYQLYLRLIWHYLG